MTATVLTDTEIDRLMQNTPLSGGGSWTRIHVRAVEQAVLARLRDPSEGILHINCVSESIARERECAAFQEGAIWVASCGEYGNLAARNRQGEAECRYPLPSPEPEVVVGPSGAQYRMKDGALQFIGEHGAAAWVRAANIRVADVQVVADLLKRAKP